MPLTPKRHATPLTPERDEQLRVCISAETALEQIYALADEPDHSERRMGDNIDICFDNFREQVNDVATRDRPFYSPTGIHCLITYHERCIKNGIQSGITPKDLELLNQIDQKHLYGDPTALGAVQPIWQRLVNRISRAGSTEDDGTMLATSLLLCESICTIFQMLPNQAQRLQQIKKNTLFTAAAE